MVIGELLERRQMPIFLPMAKADDTYAQRVRHKRHSGSSEQDEKETRFIADPLVLSDAAGEI